MGFESLLGKHHTMSAEAGHTTVGGVRDDDVRNRAVGQSDLGMVRRRGNGAMV